MEVILAIFPLKTWIFAAGFGGLFTVFKAKYKNFILGKEYEKNLKEIKKNYLYSIRNDLQTNKEQYIKDNLSGYDIRKLEEITKKIFKNENFGDLINKEVKDCIDDNKFENHTSYFNILVLGSTGIGKSTLINSVLKLEENAEDGNFAKCGRGRPVTLGEPHPYISDKVKGLKLWDSQGIDKSGYGINQLKESVENLIQTNASQNNPDNFIHCIWYCLTAHRFEVIERNFLIDLMKIYHDENLPIIIVYTQCISEEDGEKMSSEINKICMEQGHKIEVIPVLAKDKIVGTKEKRILIEKYGIDKLLSKSFDKIESAVQSACFHSIRERIKNSYKLKLKKKHQKIKEVLNESLSNINSEIPLEQLKEKQLKLFEIVINILIYDNEENKPLSQNSITSLVNILKEYINICNEKLDKFLEQKVIEISVNLANSYLKNQNETKEKSDKINQGIVNNVTNQILENVSIFKTIGLNTGSKEIKSKYKEMEEWQKISEDEVSKEFHQKIQAFFNKRITKFIVWEFIRILTETMMNSFNDSFNKIDDYMIEKTGEEIKLISKGIIQQLKQNEK